MEAFVWLGAFALFAAVVLLVHQLHVRFPLEERLSVGDWDHPEPKQRLQGAERGFDRTVTRVELARSNPADWQHLLSHLDEIADVVDPRPETGRRRVLPHRSGWRFWEQLDEHGVPVSFNADYLSRRLAILTRQSNVASPKDNR